MSRSMLVRLLLLPRTGVLVRSPNFYVGNFCVCSCGTRFAIFLLTSIPNLTLHVMYGTFHQASICTYSFWKVACIDHDKVGILMVLQLFMI